MKFNRQFLASSASAGFAAAWIFAVVIPVQSYLANSAAFGYSLGALLGEYWLYFAIGWMATTVLLLLAGKFIGEFLHIAVLAIVMAAIVESGPLSAGLPLLNGNLEGYESASRMVLDSCVLMVVLILPFVFYRFARRHVLAMAGVVILYSGAMLADVGFRSCADDRLAESFAVVKSSRGDVVGSTEFSANDNVFLLILDSMSVDVVRDILTHDKELAERFCGFVNYVNNLGMQWPTAAAMPGMMTGMYFERSVDLPSYMTKCLSKDSFVGDAVAGNIPTYVSIALQNGSYTNAKKDSADYGQVRALPPSRVKMDGLFRFTVNGLSCFRILPYAVRKWYLTRIAENEVECNAEQADFTADGVLWTRLVNCPVNRTTPRALHVFHTNGGHPPLVYDENGRRSLGDNRTYGAYLAQSKYALRRVAVFLDALKTSGVYDVSTIILCADHGIWISQSKTDHGDIPMDAFPFLMVKARRATGVCRESDLPTSHARIAPLVRKLLKNTLDAAGIDSLLREQGERMCQESSAGAIRRWFMSPDGRVRCEETEDREPSVEELRPLAFGKAYSFIISDQCNYADFRAEGGCRRETSGLAIAKDRMTVYVRIPKNSSKIAVRLNASLKLFSDGSNALDIRCGGRTKTILGSPRKFVQKEIVFPGLQPSADGILRIEFKARRPHSFFAVAHGIRIDADTLEEKE